MSAIDGNHQFLLNPSLVKATMKTLTETDDFNINVIINLNNIVLSISKEQLPVISKITPVAAEIFKFEDKKSLTQKVNFSKSNKDRVIHCVHLDILPIDFDISFFINTPRQTYLFEANTSIPRFLAIIPTIDDFHFQLSPIKAADLQCTEEKFFLILLDYAKSSFSSHWLRLIGSAAIIGNPQKLIKHFSSAFKSPAKKIPKELLIGNAGTFGTILKTGETVLKGISSTFQTVSHDDSQYIKDNKTVLGGLSWVSNHSFQELRKLQKES